MSIDTVKWFESISDAILSNPYQIEITQASYATLLKQALCSNKQLFNKFIEGTLAKPEIEKGIDSDLMGLGGKLVAHDLSDKRHEKFFIWDDGYAEYSNADGKSTVKIAAFDRGLLENIEKIFKKHLSSRIEAGNVFVISSGSSGPSFKNLGVAALSLELDNYSPDVSESIQHVIQDLSSPAPCGRMVILHGVPGSGKSFMIRGMLSSVKNAMWVIVPPDMVGELVGPSLINLIADNKDDFSEPGPIIFIIEDGDRILAPRGPDNIHALSGLLNLSDGLLGSMMDVRVVATTNAPHSEIEPALLRPGRLCRRVHIGELEKEQAQRIYFRLTGKEMVFNKNKITLAEVYRLARQDGWVAPKIQNGGRMGFEIPEEVLV